MCIRDRGVDKSPAEVYCDNRSISQMPGAGQDFPGYRFQRAVGGACLLYTSAEKSLTREMAVTLVDKIYVYEDKRLKIEFNYRDEIAYDQELLKMCIRDRKEAA